MLCSGVCRGRSGRGHTRHMPHFRGSQKLPCLGSEYIPIVIVGSSQQYVALLQVNIFGIGMSLSIRECMAIDNRRTK